MAHKDSSLKILGTAVAGAAALAAYTLLIRPWHLGWGATDVEIEEPLPGDELVPNPKQTATHAITIKAPVADVWPWLVSGFGWALPITWRFSAGSIRLLMPLGLYALFRQRSFYSLA